MNTKLNIQTDIRWAFAYFAIVVCLGIFMRSVQVADYPFVFNYRNIVHTHSHLALLGFVYVMLSAILARTFIPFNTQLHKRYRWLFYITQFSVLGMLCSFPFQGYGAISISFSSVFIICTYFFAKFFIKYATSPFVKMGIFYLILSSLGIWFMPVTIVKFGKFSEMYMCSIAFFLHFQYNGWMLSSLMGLFVKKYGWDIQYPQQLSYLLYRWRDFCTYLAYLCNNDIAFIPKNSTKKLFSNSFYLFFYRQSSNDVHWCFPCAYPLFI